MATWRVNNSALLGGEVCAPWQAGHAYALGARCVCGYAYSYGRRSYVYECTTAGTSHATTQPTWPTSGTVNDGTVVWTTRRCNDGAWDNATCVLRYAVNAAADGDTILVDDGHNENVNLGSNAYAYTGGAKDNPKKIICVDKATDALSVGAVVKDGYTGGLYDVSLSSYAYSYGVKYVGSDADSMSIRRVDI